MDESTPASDPEEGAPNSPAPSERAPGGVELLTLGLTVAVTILVVGAIGYFVDRWLGTSPIFTLIGLVLGIAAAGYMAVSTVRKYL
jgi:F0F1-type ATP synthase assembly protein I